MLYLSFFLTVKHKIDFQLNTPDENRKLPIDYALDLGYIDICKFLIQNGALFFVENHKKYFLDAALHNDLELVKLFVEHGKFDIELFDEDWETPIFKAIKGKSYSVFKYLCNRGSNLTISNKFNITLKQLIIESSCKLITHFYEKFEQTKRFLTCKDYRSTFNKSNFEILAKVIRKNTEFDCLNKTPNSRK